MNNHDIASHQIAKHLRAIAVLLTDASEDAWRAYCPGSERIKPEYLEMLITKAAAIEATAPFEPVPDSLKDKMRDFYAEQLNDRSTHEMVDDLCGDWTEAEWRSEADDYAELMEDE